MYIFSFRNVHHVRINKYLLNIYLSSYAFTKLYRYKTCLIPIIVWNLGDSLLALPDVFSTSGSIVCPA